MCARTCKGIYQNHRTTELRYIIHVSHSLSGSVAVLWGAFGLSVENRPFGKASRANGLAVLRSNKEWGGYSTTAFAGRSSADLGLDGGTARGKFRAQDRAGGVAGRSIEVGAASAGNRAISGVCAAGFGRVGMAALERLAISVSDQGFAVSLRQPAGLVAGRVADRLGTPGVGLAGEGGTPPSRAAISPSSMAQPIFSISIDLRIRWPLADVLEWQGRLTSSRKMGSGVCVLSLAARDWCDDAVSLKQQRWVGVQGAVLSWGRSRETTVLWGGLHGVN